MPHERFLVTGALGCIGAWVVRTLLHEHAAVTVFDRASDPHRLRLVLDDDELRRVSFIAGDLADFEAVRDAMRDARATHVIHLAALQVPFCKADPVAGAQVNVVGTVNVFEAANQLGIARVVYASSAAVYGISEEYPEGAVAHDAVARPRTLYGVYKLANEGTAQVYWRDAGVASIGLRPYIVYGPGRDQGLTSGPTRAMLAAAAGQPFHIPFGGRFDLQYAGDVAAAFVRAARVPFEGAEVFNLHGAVVSMSQILQAIETAAPAMRGRMSFDDTPLGFPPEMDASELVRVLGEPLVTPVQDGVASTIATFRDALEAGRIAAPSA